MEMQRVNHLNAKLSYGDTKKFVDCGSDVPGNSNYFNGLF